uniref:NEK4 n=1 Tax=Arundo donax TaxID=35708 RepID=A0A0A8XX74_ARUDO
MIFGCLLSILGWWSTCLDLDESCLFIWTPEISLFPLRSSGDAYFSSESTRLVSWTLPESVIFLPVLAAPPDVLLSLDWVLSMSLLEMLLLWLSDMLLWLHREVGNGFSGIHMGFEASERGRY